MLQDGRTFTADFVVQATGQSPNTQLLETLEPSSTDSLINPKNGFIRVKPTMQFADPAYPHLFAVGDVADSGAHKAARPAAQQAVAAAKNIAAMIEGRQPSEEISVSPAGIHLTLGLVRLQVAPLKMNMLSCMWWLGTYVLVVRRRTPSSGILM